VPLEDRRDLGRRDAGAVPVRQPEIRLAERLRPRRAAGVEPVGREEAEDDPQRILDDDTVPQDDRPERRRRHRVSVASSPETMAPRSPASPASPVFRRCVLTGGRGGSRRDHGMYP
jgi:hypothetical protein